jgi:Ring hydroxylating alpha subunit (catalytic domain)
MLFSWLNPLRREKQRRNYHSVLLCLDPGDAVEILDLVNRQDWIVCELAQQGMSSKAFARGGNYSPLEHHIRGFVDYILEKLA